MIPRTESGQPFSLVVPCLYWQLAVSDELISYPAPFFTADEDLFSFELRKRRLSVFDGGRAKLRQALVLALSAGGRNTQGLLRSGHHPSRPGNAVETEAHLTFML